MERGSKARTVASTNMNQTSSRAHTLFSIILTITEIDRENAKATDRVSKITLVDLAGSERQSATGATGARLKEGCAINQSLSALGNVISTLVKKGNAKGRAKSKIFIPYRTSILTWLLRESLGGNAKTIMVAALSPASINYEETFSTLKYADRAKQIKNQAVVNEDPNVTLIKGLKKELEDLKRKLAMTNTGEMERLMEQLKESQKLISRLQQSDKEAEREKQNFKNQQSDDLTGVGFSDVVPCITNLHPDEMMNSKIIFLLKDNVNYVGKTIKSKIKLGGATIEEEHCKILNENNEMLFIDKIGTESKGRTYVNGVKIDQKTQLHHLDRIIFGSNHTFRVWFPFEKNKIDEKKQKEQEDQYDYVFSQQEFAEKNNLFSKSIDIKQYEKMDKNEKEKIFLQKVKQHEEKQLIAKQQEEKEDPKDEIIRRIQEEYSLALKNLEKESKLKDLIIDSFIPPEEVRKIENRAIWLEEEEEYYIKNLHTLAGNIACEKRKSARGHERPTIQPSLSQNFPRYKVKNILDFQDPFSDMGNPDEVKNEEEPAFIARVREELKEDENEKKEKEKNKKEKVIHEKKLKKSKKNGNFKRTNSKKKKILKKKNVVSGVLDQSSRSDNNDDLYNFAFSDDFNFDTTEIRVRKRSNSSIIAKKKFTKSN